MLEVKDINIIIDSKYIVKSLSFTLNKGDKLAIIGEEGNGKSTLLKCLLGICNYAKVEGTINYNGNSIGYLQQSLNEEDNNKKVFDYVFKNEFDYYNKTNRLYKYLKELQLNDQIFSQKIKFLSGGEKIKVSILKILLEENDILVLDEPTNDLDIETLEWLENFINNINKPIIYVSHDETLLSNTANVILHLELVKKKSECKHTFIKINYDEYIKRRLNAINKQTQISKSEQREFIKKEKKLRQIMQKVEYQQNTITRANPYGGKLLKKKMHSLKSQEKKLEKTNLTELPDVEESINFCFENVFIPKTKQILKLDIDKLEINDKQLATKIKLDVIGPEHICIIGQNGVGKTTLIKKIYDELITRNDIKVGYMPQSYEDVLNQYKNVLDFIAYNKTKEEVSMIRNYLGNMKLTGEEMTGQISSLSPGTKAKLFLAKLVLEKCSVLVLDEPTRNVSPLSNPVIRNELKKFNGTIISISHDRKFINEVIDKVYILKPNGLKSIDTY